MFVRTPLVDNLYDGQIALGALRCLLGIPLQPSDLGFCGGEGLEVKELEPSACAL